MQLIAASNQLAALSNASMIPQDPYVAQHPPAIPAPYSNAWGPVTHSYAGHDLIPFANASQYASVVGHSYPVSPTHGYHFQGRTRTSVSHQQHSDHSLRNAPSPLLDQPRSPQHTVDRESAILDQLVAFKSQYKKLEVENERRGKELEIARWRLACVEVERKAEIDQVGFSERLIRLTADDQQSRKAIRLLLDENDQLAQGQSGSGDAQLDSTEAERVTKVCVQVLCSI